MNYRQAKTFLSRYISWETNQPLNSNGVIATRKVESLRDSEPVIGALTRLVKDAYRQGRQDGFDSGSRLVDETKEK
jgi:hypothetical protein